jgi:DNA-binding response OmpR family regulator
LSGGSPVVVEADWTDSFQLASTSGADATLKKPVLPSELMATVERLLAN